jgi:hypothetical protein
MADERIYSFGTVRRWLGNPFALAALRFVTQKDECGDRSTITLTRRRPIAGDATSPGAWSG